MKKFMFGNMAVSPVIGTILMVAITVIMAAIIGGFVYQTSRPKVSPNLATTLEDDQRVVLTTTAGTDEGRVAKLTIEGGKNIAKSELKAIVTYTDFNNASASSEYTVVLDGSSWTAGSAVIMGTTKIGLVWIDSDVSGDINPGDRLDFEEGLLSDTDVDGEEVEPGTDFTAKIVHKSTEATLASHTIKVY